MGNKQKIFQYVLLGFFGILMVGGLIVLSFSKEIDSKEVVTVTSDTVIWGPPFPSKSIYPVLKDLPEGSPLERTKYVAKKPDTFYSELVEAIATNRGPDAVIIDSSMLLQLLDKIQPMPYESFPLLSYQNLFVDGASIYALDKGIYMYPLVIDPLVLYWNRNLFTNAGLVKVPQDWVTFIEYVTKLAVVTEGGDVVQSAVALGEYQNVLHAKEILSALLLQSGTSIVKKERRFESDIFTSATRSTTGLALRFYTDFSNPVKNVYSWNKTLDRSREGFAANKVAMYGGFLSEKDTVDLLNPNLNYSIAVWPQSIREGSTKATYGRIYGIAVLKSSRDPISAFTVASALISPQNAAIISQSTRLPSAQRNLLVESPTDPFASIGVQSARIARSWLEPDAEQMNDVFKRAIEDVVVGQLSPEKSAQRLHEDIDTLLERYIAY